jgi:hypothetical protein
MISNQIASLINNMIIILYSNGIHFYQIIIGLLVFNVIVYNLCNLIRESKKVHF